MRTILIAGYGKMGSWLWELLKGTYQCAVYETNPEVKLQNPSVVFIESPFSISELKPDIFINCVSLKNTIQLFRELLPYLPAECILSDIASVKNNLRSYYPVCNRRFASVHPMFGPTFTDMSNPAGRKAYIISESDNNAKKFFEEIFKGLGISIIECNFEEHDRQMAKYLSEPILMAMLFARTGATMTVGGTTHERFHELSRQVLSEDSGLLNSILSNPYTCEVISSMTGYLIKLNDSVKSGNTVNTEDLLANLIAEKR